MKSTTNQVEQEICVSCGFCCDHTIFDIVIIQDDEYINEHFTDADLEIEGKRYFPLPCPYFDSKCTIYDQRKPKRCSEFKCQVLKSVNDKEISSEDAQVLIADIRIQRDHILKKFTDISGKKMTFRALVKFFEQQEIDQVELSSELKILYFEVNILRVHITKWFRSKNEMNELFEIK